MSEATAPTVAADARWLVCHTKPRCEKKFAALLKAEGIEFYLALIQSVRRYRTQTKKFTKPLFPGYVFARVPLAAKSRIYQQDLLARTIAVDDEKRFLVQLDAVRAIVESGLELTVLPLVKRGARVRVTSGPLWGVEGVVDDPVNPQGIVIAMDVLQQGLHVRIPLENLEVLP